MDEQPIAWIRTSFDDLLGFPVQVKKEAGYQLHRIQHGYQPENYKPFKQVGPGVN
jgi:phage-related protein